jgi:hypothetical protein
MPDGLTPEEQIGLAALQEEGPPPEAAPITGPILGAPVEVGPQVTGPQFAGGVAPGPTSAIAAPVTTLAPATPAPAPRAAPQPVPRSTVLRRATPARLETQPAGTTIQRRVLAPTTPQALKEQRQAFDELTEERRLNTESLARAADVEAQRTNAKDRRGGG